MCESHEPNTVLLPRGRGLCRTGIGIFIQALDRVENINGMARGAATAGRSGVFGRMAGVLRFVSVWLGTWQHSTIARRVAFLETLAENPRLERRFQWKVTLLRWGLLLILLSGVVGIATWKGWRSLLEGV